MQAQKTISPATFIFDGAVKNTWRFFSSIKLALALILVISAFSLFGTFITGVDVFHSWWFLTTGALLILNIIVCSLNRWGNIKLSLRGGSVKQDEGFYSSGACNAEIENVPKPDYKASRIPVKVLQKHGYRVRIENHDSNYYFAADKNRFFRLGTYASHLSLVLFVLAYLIGSYFGFRDTNFTTAIGNTRPIGHNTGLSLQLVSFVDEYYADNMPKDYRSQVILYKNGQQVKQAVFPYKSSYTWTGNVAIDKLISNQGLQRYVGSIDLPNGLNIQLISSAINVQDPLIPLGQLAIYVKQDGNQIGAGLAPKGAAVAINDMELTYQADSKFSGFQVSRDPGNNLIWVAATLFILGLVLVLYFPYRQVWVLYQTRAAGTNLLSLRLSTSRGLNGTSELKILVDKMEKELLPKT